MAARCRVLLQCDWEACLSQKEGSVWVALQDLTGNPARATIRGRLTNHGMSASGLLNVVGNHGFSVKKIMKNRIAVGYCDETSSQPFELEMTFQSPTICFSEIHDPKTSVICLDVSDGGLGVSSSSDGTLKVWQSDTGEVRRTLEGHIGDVNTCRLFPSGIVVLSGGADMRLKVWAADTGKCAATFIGHKSAVLNTAIVERGRNIISCSSDGTAKLWDCSQQACLDTYEGMAGSVNSCAVSDTHSSVLLGEPNQPPVEKEVLTEGKMLLLGCENNSLLAYGLQSRKKIFEYECTDAVNSCTFLSETIAVCGAEDGMLTLIDLRNYNVALKEWKMTNSPIKSLFPHNGGFFVSSRDGSCCYVNNQYNETLSLSGPDCDPVYHVTCNNTNIFTACRDGFIRKYKLN